MKRNDPTVLAKNAKIRKSRSWYQNLAKRGQIRANPSPPPFLRPPPNSDTARDRFRRPAHPLQVNIRGLPQSAAVRRGAAGDAGGPRAWSSCVRFCRTLNYIFYHCNWTRLNMGLVFPRICLALSESDMSPFAISSLRGLCVVLVSPSHFDSLASSS